MTSNEKKGREVGEEEEQERSDDLRKQTGRCVIQTLGDLMLVLMLKIQSSDHFLVFDGARAPN